MAPVGSDMKTELKLTLGLLLITTHLACSGGDETPNPSGQGGGAAGSTSSGASGGGGTAGTTSAGGTSATAGTTSTAGQGGASGSSSGGSAGATVNGGSASTGGVGGGAAGASAMDGATLYLTNCAACHGQQGVGGPLAPELQHPVRDYSTWVVRHGRAMTTFPAPMLAVASDKLTDANLTSIWDYLSQPAQPTTGQALYLDYCGNCHGADGKGGPTARNILNELDGLKEQVRQGSHLGQFDMRREYMPAFSTTQISDADLDRIFTYVEGL